MTRLVLALAVLSAFSARAGDEVPLDKQKGVRGRVIVAAELLTSPVKLSAARDKALRSPAIVKRPLGRPLAPMLEPAPALVVMLEGEGIRQENADLPKLRIEGRRFLPGSLVMPRVGSVRIENKQREDVVIVDENNAVVAKVPANGTVDAPLKLGEHTLSIQEMPYATASVRVLERGRALQLRDQEIPLTDIPGGEYQLSFYFGAEPLRVQPLQVPDQGLVFIDATVSALKVVEVSIKDSSMRVAVPPGKEDGSP
jgi:hypothetical protein